MAKLSANGTEIARLSAWRDDGDIVSETELSVRSNGAVLRKTRVQFRRFDGTTPGDWSGWKHVAKVKDPTDTFGAERAVRNFIVRRGWTLR